MWSMTPTSAPPHTKPLSCAPCILKGNGKGFIYPEMGGGNGVLVVDGSPSVADGLKGGPLHGIPGYQFDKILRRAGLRREDFGGIDSLVHCVPNHYGNYWKLEQGIQQCAPHLSNTIQQVKPRCILALGGGPFKDLTGLSGITKHRGFVYESKHNIPVVGTLHPEYLLPRKKDKGGSKYTWVVMMDIRKALRVASGKQNKFPQRYLLDPSIDVAKQFIGEYLQRERVKLAWDLETLYKLKQKNEQELKLENKQVITRISFAFQPGHAMSIPWTPDYRREIIEPLFRLDRPKVGWNCPTPTQRVLTADLLWVDAGSLVVGDELIAFDAEVQEGRKNRRYNTAIVTNATRGIGQVKRVSFNDGTSVEVTNEHPWLITWYPKRGNTRTKWVKTKDLHIGDVFTRRLPLWQTNTSHSGGYLAGVYDGEGSLSTTETGTGAVAFSQNAGGVQLRTTALLKDCGFTLGLYATGRCITQEQDGFRHIKIGGGAPEVARFLGSVRPQRLLSKFTTEMLGSVSGYRMPQLTITAIVDLGEQEIVQLSTSTATYMLEGFGAHNSKGFDEPIILLQEGMEMNGPLLDGMDQFKVFQPNIERNLEFVASILVDHLQAWKHRSQSDPEWYSAVDSDAAISIVDQLDDIMRQIEVPEYAVAA